MINCRSLGIPFSPQLHLPIEQPMALLKVIIQFTLRSNRVLIALLLFLPPECTQAARQTKTIVPKSLGTAGASKQENEHGQLIATARVVGRRSRVLGE
jgi:hypothetical protein